MTHKVFRSLRPSQSRKIARGTDDGPRGSGTKSDGDHVLLDRLYQPNARVMPCPAEIDDCIVKRDFQYDFEISLAKRRYKYAEQIRRAARRSDPQRAERSIAESAQGRKRLRNVCGGRSQKQEEQPARLSQRNSTRGPLEQGAAVGPS